jgi:hypothetical protein
VASPTEEPRPPEQPNDALARAREHGLAAAAETVAAIHALLDAAALAASGEPSKLHPMLGPLATLLADLERRLENHEPGARVVDAISEALDVEIGRWEERAQEDPEARAVLRAFLGLRELLWEFGVRRRSRTPSDGRRGGRVQRVPVEG